jgi:hypothetical protein
MSVFELKSWNVRSWRKAASVGGAQILPVMVEKQTYR